MLYRTKYEKQLDLIKLNERMVKIIRKYITLLDDKAEIKKNNLKIKFYEAQTKLYRQKAKKLKNSPEGKEVAEILSYNAFGNEEECIEEQQKERDERLTKIIEQALKERMDNNEDRKQK